MSLSISAGPLEKSEKLFLIFCAAAVILACYLFSLLSVVVLLLVVAVEIATMIVLMRFGLGGLVIKVIQRHMMLIGIFARNLWLGKGVDYQIPLVREDAPGLFDLLDSLASRLGIEPPHEVFIEMSFNACVRLHGYVTKGKTVLGIGYDLLTAFNLSEFEAVMAHEMAHAKLVKRGLKSWLNGGLARIGRVSRALGACVDSYRAEKRSFALATFFRTCSDGMTRLAARLISAYSRQDEFEADREAAQLFGAAAMRAALVRLNAVEPKLERLPWAERVGRIETESSFSQWLMRELTVPQSEVQQAANFEARDPYSTHPSLHDRLMALPEGGASEPDPTPALSLLLQPDKIAAALIEEIHRIATVQEEKDLKQLVRAARRLQGSPSSLRWAHLPGMLLFVIAFIMFVTAMGVEDARIFFPVSLLLGGLSVWLFKRVRYRDPRILPVPRFAELKRAWQKPALPDLGASEKKLESELVSSYPRKKYQRMEFLLGEAYSSLGRCDYLRAHVATRLALQIDNKSIEAALGNAIASASLGMATQVGNMLKFIHKKAGLASPQIVWGAAWAFTLLGDWTNAEAFLWKKHQEIPGEPAFLTLLALVQQQRGKLQSAIAHASQALALSPQDIEVRKLLARCLLDAGRLQATAQQLDTLADHARTDWELMLLMVRLKLLQQDLASAQEWAGYFHKDERASSLIQVAGLFEHARQDKLAGDYFHLAVQQGFYPEAELGLARIAARKKEMLLSRQHLLSALNVEIPPPIGSKGPAHLFQEIINSLMQLDRVREHCRAWVVEFPADLSPKIPPALRACRMMVYGPTREAAIGYLDEILQAMQPSLLSLTAGKLRWTDAAKVQQPERPVYPGVQGVL